MATLTPSRNPSSGDSPKRGGRKGGRSADIRPTTTRQAALWLRAVLDRPLTSYHLVLGSVALLLVVGLMMVLSASSVNAYLNTGDSYYYVKRQVMFLVIGVIGALVIMRLPVSTLRWVSWVGIGLAAVLLILT